MPVSPIAKRQLTPREINHLLRFAYPLDKAQQSDVPVDYLTGFAPFRNRDFIVSPSVLIPRLETESIVDTALQWLFGHPAARVIADIGTGSGVLGLSLAIESQSDHNTGYFLSDISADALAICRQNYRRFSHLISSPVHIFKSDLLVGFPKGIRIAILLANLPYLPADRLIDDADLTHEPRLALDGGDRGTAVIQRLIDQLPDFAAKEFLAILEIDDTHQLTDFVFPTAFRTRITKDIFGRRRFLLVHRVSTNI